MRRLLAACLVLSGGCFNPDLDAYVYNCSAAAPACPDGYSCIAGRCSHGDAPVAVADLQPPTTAAGCASGQGYQLGTNVYACPGTFSPGAKAASTVCSTAYKPCVSNAGITFTGTSCDSPPVPSGATAFYVANILGSHARMQSASTATCTSTADVLRQNVWFGCGQSGPSFVTTTAQACQGLTRAIDCAASGSPLSCSYTQTSLDQLTSTDPTGGVLCCARAVQ